MRSAQDYQGAASGATAENNTSGSGNVGASSFRKLGVEGLKNNNNLQVSILEDCSSSFDCDKKSMFYIVTS